MEADYKKTDISKKIVDLSTSLFRQAGYKAFSYRDLAKAIGIKTSSIHYYFPTKDDLALVIVKQHRNETAGNREAINSRSQDPKARLEMYLDSYIDTFKKDDNIGFCTMLASDSDNLPQIVNEEVKKLFLDDINWITGVIEAGDRKNIFQIDQNPKDVAEIIFSFLQGAAVNSNTLGDEKILDNASDVIKKMLASKDKGIISKYLSIGR
ncbi:MAG: TetR/AcrR family transcriptional regulator [Candidatus Dadabacteria bacterium]|nr:TetR/AcrR family transcriptional regulator [Candidatus Dadabacteria bacterium]NIS07963.1 TetR/AcrR family transcriptional regulator [Candidatus Dadabacteria bacterium]NIV43056.1 TetR family transcriptional regulator [Candidatus Dadabacteria bacterium]NIX14919.1 TetR family transcriptional regulator [Candidatus Dadabacteria bacterium]NIY21547.1 TetR family transcriptional regulator [Candidatus Dadabacteria bacterium]